MNADRDLQHKAYLRTDPWSGMVTDRASIEWSRIVSMQYVLWWSNGCRFKAMPRETCQTEYYCNQSALDGIANADSKQNQAIKSFKRASGCFWTFFRQACSICLADYIDCKACLRDVTRKLQKTHKHPYTAQDSAQGRPKNTYAE